LDVVRRIQLFAQADEKVGEGRRKGIKFKLIDLYLSQDFPKVPCKHMLTVPLNSFISFEPGTFISECVNIDSKLCRDERREASQWVNKNADAVEWAGVGKRGKKNENLRSI
jgi:hypothetical protein